ncbi:MAG: hypothetical protein FWG44_05195 [Oscillospiraceae bacterium]|nr:hypothetical protein [Oscillospiraceae bacterium]
MKLKKLFAALVAVAVLAGFQTTSWAEDGDDSEEEGTVGIEPISAEIGEADGEEEEEEKDERDADDQCPPEWKRPSADDIDTNWRNAKWVEVNDRGDGWEGVQFVLSTFMEEIGDDAADGFYEWIFIVGGGHPILGNDFKVLTQDGDQTPPYKRFTDREAKFGDEVVKATRFNDPVGDDTAPSTGHIPGDWLMQAAESGQNMRFSNQSYYYDFVIKEIIVNRYAEDSLDNPVPVYIMSEDPIIQGYAVGQKFGPLVFDENGESTVFSASMGLIPCGAPTFVIIQDGVDPEPVEPPASSNTNDENDESTSDSNDSSSDDKKEETPSTPTGSAGADEEDGESSFPWLPVGIGAGAVIIVGGALVAVNLKKKS